jgi:hypothetical protein
MSLREMRGATDNAIQLCFATGRHLSLLHGSAKGYSVAMVKLANLYALKFETNKLH